MSIEYNYLISIQTANGLVVSDRLISEIKASEIATDLLGTITHIDEDKLTVIMASMLSTIDEALLNELVAAHTGEPSLGEVKAAKFVTIDRRTSELIEQGFSYSNKVFSLSLNAQSTMLGTHQVKDSPLMVYPIKWNTLNDLDAILIADAAELDVFCLTALATYRAHIDSGTILKDLVRSALTVEDIEAITDNR